MKVIADTNLLLRAVLPDDGQRAAAIAELAGADVVAISIHALCELVWVLSRRYETSRTDLAATVRGVVAVENVAVDHAALAAGLAMLDAGGDFADGVIAHDGRSLGGDVFVSFDRRAVRLVQGWCRDSAARPGRRRDDHCARVEMHPTERCRFVGASLSP